MAPRIDRDDPSVTEDVDGRLSPHGRPFTGEVAECHQGTMVSLGTYEEVASHRVFAEDGSALVTEEQWDEEGRPTKSWQREATEAGPHAAASQAVLERLRSAPWGDWDASMAHRDSRAVLMREYLRRAAAWARETGAERQWPFFDLAGRLRPGWEPEPALLAALDDIFAGQEPGGRVRATCHAAVRWAALRDADPGLTLPPLPDPYEPLLLMYERGGGFYTKELIELNGVAIRRGTVESNLSPRPFLDLHPAALDSLDDEGDIRYYAKTDEKHPRSHPRGIVRRRVTATATHDEAFTRNLRWEPTEYLRRYGLGHNEVDHMEISAFEAVLFMERIPR